MSKATIVSLLPFPIEREMTGHNPHFYNIPKAAFGDFELLVIGDTTDSIYVGESKSVIRDNLAYNVARELIDTYKEACVFTGPDAYPGLFYVEGEHDKESIKDNFPDLLEKADKENRNWYLNLIKAADDSWQKFHTHRDISTPQRLAAAALGQKRPWLIEAIVGNSFQDCPACGTTIKANVSVCPQCRAKIKESEFEFAG